MLKLFRDAGEHEAMTSVWITIIIDHDIVKQESILEVTKVKFAKATD